MSRHSPRPANKLYLKGGKKNTGLYRFTNDSDIADPVILIAIFDKVVLSPPRLIVKIFQIPRTLNDGSWDEEFPWRSELVS